MSRAEEVGEASAPKPDGQPEARPPGLMRRLKQHAKDAVIASTSTHGGVAGGIGGRKSRKKNPD